MKYYIREIKPFIYSPGLQGFRDTEFPVKGYDWVSEDMEEELRNTIEVKDPWGKLIIHYRLREACTSEYVSELEQKLAESERLRYEAYAVLGQMIE